VVLFIGLKLISSSRFGSMGFAFVLNVGPEDGE
jgi:hypothetical protein